MEVTKYRSGDSAIVDWYDGRSVFITGGTGFLGKVLVEKLLRSCPGIKHIFLLLRPKNGHDTVQSRLDEMLNEQLFRRIHSECPSALSKLVAVAGDVNQERLGLSAADVSVLVKEVSVVFHSAATVRFDEPLKVAVHLNLIGVRSMIELARQMTNLAVFVHVSTSFCNCDRYQSEEIVYPHRFDPEEIMSKIPLMKDEEANALSPELLGNLPNTYIFTKRLAEIYLERISSTMPIAIIRPSIVLSSLREPFPGWIDGQNGPIQFVGGIYEAIIRSSVIDSTKITDFIPVDTAINVAIVAAWYSAVHSPRKLQVYNSASGSLNPCSWGDFQYWIQYHIVRNPLPDCTWFPRITFHNWLFRHHFEDFAYHYVPALIMDTYSKAVGKEPILLGLHQKLKKVMRILEFFSNGEWSFGCSNTLQLSDKISSEERRIFQMDPRDIDWPTYFSHFIAGIRKYQMKRPLKKFTVARKRVLRMRTIMRLLQYVSAVIIGIPIKLMIDNIFVYTISIPEYIVGCALFVWLMVLLEPPSFNGAPTVWTDVVFGDGRRWRR